MSEAWPIPAPADTGTAPQADEPRCPLCSRVLNERWTRKPVRKTSINDVVVCKKCRHGFANRRQGAYIIDATAFNLLWGLVWFAGLGLLGRAPFSNLSPSGLSPVLSAFLVLYSACWAIFLCKDGFSGMSLGKRLCGVRVVDWDTHEPIGFAGSFRRNLCLLTVAMPGAVAGGLTFASPAAPAPWVLTSTLVSRVIALGVLLGIASSLLKGWRWGDKWAGTRVIWRKNEFKPPFDPRGLRCTTCGYDLTGNVSGRCPECGTPIALPTAIPVPPGGT